MSLHKNMQLSDINGSEIIGSRLVGNEVTTMLPFKADATIRYEVFKC